jgi:hypothetical protein
MSKDKPRKRLSGPWRSIHGALWLIGLAIIAWQDWWWPGILVLVALSILVEALLKRFAPQAYEEEQQPAIEPEPSSPPISTPAEPQPTSQPTTTTTVPPAQEHRLELLPSECPKCGGPIRGHEVRWTGSQSADCPYCGANLPMAKV